MCIMACCTTRTFLLTVCILQLVFTIERQVFDFLGYMWVPIVGNFFQILFTIFGFFGAYQHRPRYVVAYALWTFIWLGWNIFVICFYLEAGILSRESSYLNIGTESRSWWEVNGFGCNPTYNLSLLADDPLAFTKPVEVSGCLLEYFYIECIQAGVQCLLALLGFSGACYTLYVYLQEDDSFDFIGGFDSYSAYHSPTKTSHMHLQPIYGETKPHGSAI